MQKMLKAETTKENKRENSGKRVRKNIIVMSNKGGVGKTTVAVNLAVSLARKGYRTGLLDIDMHGPNVHHMLGLSGIKLSDQLSPIQKDDLSNLSVMSLAFLIETDSQPVIWRGPIKHKLINQFINDVKWPDLDFLVMDLPPGTGDETITTMQLLPQAEAIIVSSPSRVSISDVKKAVGVAKTFSKPVIGIIENMTGEMFGKGLVDEFAAEENIPILGRLSLTKEVSKSANDGKPFVMSDSESKKEFETIVDNVLEAIE